MSQINFVAEKIYQNFSQFEQSKKLKDYQELVKKYQERVQNFIQLSNEFWYNQYYFK